MSADPTRLLALAEECEAAAGPDRKIDLALAELLGFWASPLTAEERGLLLSEATPDQNGQPQGLRIDAQQPIVPSYTGSLDAALSLLPLYAFWSLMVKGRVSGLFECAVVLRDGNGFGYRAARSPALAVCTAALRALAEEASDAG